MNEGINDAIGAVNKCYYTNVPDAALHRSNRCDQPVNSNALAPMD